MEDDAQAHDAQRVLRHPGSTRREADRDLQHVPAAPGADRRSRREVPMIANQREDV